MTLFDVYLNILDDDTPGVEVKARIRDGNWAQGALRQVITHYIGHFQLMDDLYLRERASDILDLGSRILAHLQGAKRKLEDKDFPASTILVSEELTPGMLGEVPAKKLRGFGLDERLVQLPCRHFGALHGDSHGDGADGFARTAIAWLRADRRWLSRSDYFLAHTRAAQTVQGYFQRRTCANARFTRPARPACANNRRL